MSNQFPSKESIKEANDIFEGVLKDINEGNVDPKGIVDIYALANKTKPLLDADKVKKILQNEFMELGSQKTMLVNFPNNVVYAMSNWQCEESDPLTISIIQDNKIIVSFSSSTTTSFHKVIDDGMIDLIVELVNKGD